MTSCAFSIRATVWVIRLREWHIESASVAIRSRPPSDSESRTSTSYSLKEMSCSSRSSRSSWCSNSSVPKMYARHVACCAPSSQRTPRDRLSSACPLSLTLAEV